MAKVTLSGICKDFGGLAIIKDINLEIAHRELVVFVGPSGCGKSTLLRMIAGLEDVQSGTIEMDGRRINDLPPAQRHIAMVFQSYALYPHKTVRENMGFGLRMAKEPKATIALKVAEAARVLELEKLLDRRPKELSGGQRQRVAIGRAIVRDPQLFLFDEPLSNLDAALRGQMRIEIARLHQSLNATMIYVTHDQVEAMTLADKIVVLNAGRVEQVGSPLDLYDHPANLFVATFIGSPRMNLLPGRVLRRTDVSLEIGLASDEVLEFPTSNRVVAQGDPVTLGIRPTDLKAERLDFAVEGKALVIEHLGAETHVLTQLADGTHVTASLPGRTTAAVGDTIRVATAVPDLHLFESSGMAIENTRRPRGAPSAIHDARTPLRQDAAA